VYINLKGREVEGIVPPEEHEVLRERVRDILLNLTEATRAKRVIRAVERREKLYHGPYSQKASDLTIRWDYEVVRDSLCYHTGQDPVVIQAPKRSGSARQWRGTHRPEGIFIAHGPHVKRGATVTNATLYDIAPTILYLQHHPVPDDMDGKVLTDIFTEEQLHRQPVQHCASTGVVDKTALADLDAKESEKIKNRLKDLGYLE
jgi:predicted AlkP superfamily phosphohydrolase/phosphomutase